MRLVALGSVRRGRIRRDVRVQIERTGKDMHEAPDRNHDEEANKAPQHELLTAFALLLIVTSLNEVLEDTPDEDDECESENDRHRNIVDKVDDDATRIERAVDLGECQIWKRESSTDKAKFLHKM